MEFRWDDNKERVNIFKHGVSFIEAQEAFFDPNRLIYQDTKHSINEKRWFCVGKVPNGNIITVRFTIRDNEIRIFGAGYWRKGKKEYEQRQVH
jgi:uncharacterized DUF497 family protein